LLDEERALDAADRAATVAEPRGAASAVASGADETRADASSVATPDADLEQAFVPEPSLEEPLIPTRYWYLRSGFVMSGTSGAALTAGWRRGAGATLFDLAFVGIGTDDMSLGSVRLQALRQHTPALASSIYFGGGGSLSAVSFEDDTMSKSGSGVALEGTIGVEWNRTGRRYSIEANLSLPLYEVEDRYPATLAMSFGIGM